MRKTLLYLVVALNVCAAATGCQHNVFSPPARVLPLETVDTLPPGDTGTQLEGSRHGAVFGVQAWGGTLRVRRGIAKATDVSAEMSYVHIGGDSAAHVDPRLYSMRLGAKQRLLPWLSVMGGVGGGYSAAGAFVSPELGPIVAYENPYVVPFLALRWGLSWPISPREIDTRASAESSGPYLDTPRLTWLLGTSAGLRIPIGSKERADGTLRGSLLGGIGLLRVADMQDKQTIFQGGGAFEVVL